MFALFAFASLTGCIILLNPGLKSDVSPQEDANSTSKPSNSMYWFLLERRSNTEHVYYGEPDNPRSSVLLKTFAVKTGIPGKRPTPLPQLFGREYWLLVSKAASRQNPETAPYFLSLDIPQSLEAPYGPVPYLECDGQCSWELPGPFGLHGVNGNVAKLSSDDPGSSGCIRHNDEDIGFLYGLLEPETEEIRYYIRDI